MNCKDCEHYEVCVFWTAITEINRMFSKGACGFFKDKSKIIELPCPIGSTVYMIVEKRAKCCDRHTFKFIKKTKLTWLNAERVISEFGKTVFLTREEAEKALAERMVESD